LPAKGIEPEHSGGRKADELVVKQRRWNKRPTNDAPFRETHTLSGRNRAEGQKDSILLKPERRWEGAGAWRDVSETSKEKKRIRDPLGGRQNQCWQSYD